MSELHLTIAGMGCRRCVRDVTRLLRDVSGVETIAADAGRGVIRLGGTMTATDVLHALADTSYAVRNVSEGVP